MSSISITVDAVDTTYLKESLEALGCPYICALDTDSVKDLLFRPGEARTRNLTWLLSQLSPHVDKELNSPVVNTAAPVKDSKMQRLLKVCSTLGLCGKNDYELVQGTAPTKTQTRFYRLLINMLTIRSELARDPELTADQNSTNLCYNTSQHCSTLVDSLTSSVAYRDLFSGQIDLFPPSLVCFNQEQGGKKSLPALAKLQERSGKLLADLEELHEKLATLTSSSTAAQFEELDPERVDSHRRTLRNTMGTLTQIIRTFGTCYTEEFRQWNDRPQIRLNEIGPLSKELDGQLTKLLSLLDSIKAFNTDATYLTDLEMDRKMGDPVLSQAELHGLSERVKTLREQIEVSG